MDVNIRVIISAPTDNKPALKTKLQNVLDCFYQYGNYGLLNGFKTNIPKNIKQQNKLKKDIIFRNFRENKRIIYLTTAK